MMKCETTKHCCGVGEFYGINVPDFSIKGALLAICAGGSHTHHNVTGGFGAVLFTGAWDDDETPPGFNNDGREYEDIEIRMDDLGDYIVENDLGEWLDIAEYRNPGHGSMIRAAMYVINRPKLQEWYRDNHPKPQEGHHSTMNWGGVQII